MTAGFGVWVGAVLDVPAELVGPVDEFWSQALGWSIGADVPSHPQFHQLVPPFGRSHLLVQTVQDGSPRLHLDLYTADVDAECARLASLGATVGSRQPWWQVMTSPQGFEFCLVESTGGQQCPPAVTWPDGCRSRLAQVCLDVPRGAIDTETAFWQAATGWSWTRSNAPFAGHLRPGPGGSMQLLLQELGAGGAGTTSSAHIDLGADDREAVATHLVDLGATRIETGRGWIVMRDPAGIVFCVTGQSPDVP